MSRLYEEVRIRLEEMAMITARTLKLNSGRRRGGQILAPSRRGRRSSSKQSSWFAPHKDAAAMTTARARASNSKGQVRRPASPKKNKRHEKSDKQDHHRF